MSKIRVPKRKGVFLMAKNKNKQNAENKKEQNNYQAGANNNARAENKNENGPMKAENKKNDR